MIDKDSDEHFCKDIALIDKHTGKVFNNKFRQIYIELPRFMKAEKDCENFFDCWIYNLVNMNKLEHISFKDKKAIFDRLEQVASQANLSPDEREKFETEWKIYNDYFNTIESAEKKAAAEGREEGRSEGREEGSAEEKLATARNFKACYYKPFFFASFQMASISSSVMSFRFIPS